MTAYSNQILLSLLTTRYSPILLRRFDISSDGKTVGAEKEMMTGHALMNIHALEENYNRADRSKDVT